MKYLIQHSLEESAKKFPDKIAFKDNKSSISYKVLNEKTNALAQYFLYLGIEKGDRIGIYLDRCIENTIAIYGILKARACFVPLNTTDPTNKIEEIIEDCGIKFLVSKQNVSSKIGGVDEICKSIKGIINLDGSLKPINSKTEEEVLSSSHKDLNLNILNEDLAYIMYTSGTTGRPKGIMHTHRSGLDYARFSAELYDIKPSDVFASHSALYYDISTFAYFTVPFVGATTVIASEAEVKMPVSLSQFIEREKITIWYSVPLALSQMLSVGFIEKRNLSALRWVLFGGEVFPISQLNILMTLLPNALFSNVYGPAEVNQCTVFNFNSSLKIDNTLPLGVTSFNAEVLVVDENNKSLPTNTIGELLVRSSTMMLGYWNKPELTQSKLYHDHQNGVIKSFYCTGDLVKIDELGQLLFYGRKDWQVKVRGYRVELSEVEAHITSIFNISEVAVIKTKDSYLHAYVEGSINFSEKEIKRKLSKKLSTYALPDKITFVEKIPRTQAGKIDYNCLILKS